jgi:hypothetical protein
MDLHGGLLAKHREGLEIHNTEVDDIPEIYGS